MNKQFNDIGIVLRKDTSSIHQNTIHMMNYLIELKKKIVLDEVSYAEIERKLFEAEINTQITAVPLNQLGEKTDVVIVIGGDGTLLTVARNIVNYDVPIIGVNRGRLGFLTQVSWVRESIQTIVNILSGQYIEERRSMLEGWVIRSNEVVHHALAFNEVAIGRGGQGNLIKFEVFINQEFVYLQYSDGLIVATPTGSTAYSLAAGGPILYATLPTLNLVPICPQSMSNRPIVINENSDIEVLIVNGFDSRVHFDGQGFFEIKNMDVINIKKYHKSITILQPNHYRYFNTLRQKLRWGEQLV